MVKRDKKKGETVFGKVIVEIRTDIQLDGVSCLKY